MKANPNYVYLQKQVPKERITLLQGGTRSGKTFSVIYYLIDFCRTYQNANIEIDICRDTFTALKSTAWKDFKDVLLKHGLYKDSNHNKTDHIYYLFGNVISYYGADTPDKIHGRSRDILWINEAHQFPEETIDQLFPRTRHRIIADYNPALPVDHWLDNYINEYPPLITTYRDNPFLTKAQIVDIESKKNNAYWWQVYGSGKRAQPQGAIFTDWSTGDTFPEHLTPSYGQDFGFSNDPTTLVKVAIEKDIIYVQEIYGKTQLSTNDIYQLNKAETNDRALIVADSAEPRLISELRRMGNNIKECIKGQGSITAGISTLQNYHIKVIDSPNIVKELNNYAWHDKKSGVPVDAFNHYVDSIRYIVSDLERRKHAVSFIGR